MLWGKEDLVFLGFSSERKTGLFMIHFRENKRSGKLEGRRKEREERERERKSLRLDFCRSVASSSVKHSAS